MDVHIDVGMHEKGMHYMSVHIGGGVRCGHAKCGSALHGCAQHGFALRCHTLNMVFLQESKNFLFDIQLGKNDVLSFYMPLYFLCR
jgi:hypothetical protein